LGVPAGLQMGVIAAGSAAILSVVTSFGGQTVAGFSAAQRRTSLITLPAMALGTAVNSMAGQNIGLNYWTRVKSIAKYAVVYILTIRIAIAVVIMMFGEEGIQFFIQEPEAVEFGANYLSIVALCFPFLG